MRARVERDGLDNVTIVEAGFLSYDHDARPANFVLTRNALHHLPDFWKAIALQRVASILRPGGVLRLRDLVFDFEPGDAETSIDAWLSGSNAPDSPSSIASTDDPRTPRTRANAAPANAHRDQYCR